MFINSSPNVVITCTSSKQKILLLLIITRNQLLLSQQSNLSVKDKMSKSFLPSHPQITKKVSYINSPTHSRMTNSIHSRESKASLQDSEKQMIQKIIRLKRQQIRIIKDESDHLKKYNSILLQSLEHYDPKPQLAPLQAKLQLIKKQQEQINQEIQNCQMVQENSTPQQYFIWKKNQRIAVYQSKVNQMYDKNGEERQYIEHQCSLFAEKCKNLQNQIVEYQNRLKVLTQIDHHKSETLSSRKQKQKSKVSSSQNQNIPLVSQEDLLRIKEHYQQLYSSNKMVQQNVKILSAQLNDNRDTIFKSLNKDFQASKNNLIKQLKHLRESIHEEQLVPITPKQKDYSVEPLISDYQIKMSQLKDSLSKELQTKVGLLLEPASWRDFQYQDLLETQKNQTHSYNEYKQKEEECMVQEGQIKELQRQIKQLDLGIGEYKQKKFEMQSTLNKLNLLYKK